MQSNEKKYDFGIIGLWFGRNYGSMATYYALHQTVTKMGYSVEMIENPLKPDHEMIPDKSHPYHIAKVFYNISEKKKLNRMHELNKECRGFIVGSDQLWNIGLSRPYKQMYYLGFADDSVKKISYGTSFGKDYKGTDEERKISSANLRRFDGVSVRDRLSLDICKNTFGVENAVEVCDPTFLCDREDYDKLSDMAHIEENEKYILAYILDPDAEIGERLEQLSVDRDIKVIVMLDEPPKNWESNKEHLGLTGRGNVEVKKDVDLCEWIWYYQNAESVFTDSFHGTIFSIIFKKPFITLMNVKRGAERFLSLLEPIGLSCRLFETPDCIGKYDLLESCDYDTVDEKLDKIKKDSYHWLKEVLVKKKEMPKSISLSEEQSELIKNDFKRCKRVVEYIKSYGIENIVICPNRDNWNLERLFSSDEFFKVHIVRDETSAGFFALGISQRTNKKVVLCSGAGALSAVREAKTQHLPILVMTADRSYSCGQENGFTDIFGNAVKKSFALTTRSDEMSEWKLRHDICSAVLELDHHAKGPVHVNIPLESSMELTFNDGDTWLEKRKIIDKVTLTSGDSVWKARADRLKKIRKILVIYGQNRPLSPKDEEAVNEFAERYHCVIIKDTMSNLNCDRAFVPNDVIDHLSDSAFCDNLWADVVITIGGKTSFSDKIVKKLMSRGIPVNHWNVSENGEIPDIFHHLLRVFECSAGAFFRKFVRFADGAENDGTYYKAWQDECDRCLPPHTSHYSRLYAIERFVIGIPDHVNLHIGAGDVMECVNRFAIKPDIPVLALNGGQGCIAAFLGQSAANERESYLLADEEEFVKDIHSLYVCDTEKNMHIMFINQSGRNIVEHTAEILGFRYMCSHDRDEFDGHIFDFFEEKDKTVIFEIFIE